MKILPFFAISSLLCGSSFAAATIQNFDGGAGETPVSFSNFSDPTVANGGASIQTTGGNPGGFLQVTNNVNGQHNYATLDRTQTGTVPASTFAFQFRVDNLGAGGADGFSFSYFNTSTAGITGSFAAAPFTAEDPATAGVLGFGFDTWGNGGAFDANSNSADYSEVSLFYNGALISRIDDTRLLTIPLNLKDGAWHSVTGNVNFLGASASLSIDGQSIFGNTAVPGLVPYESRVGYGARTGGANERVSIDNLNVQFVPEPASCTLLALGALALSRRRR